MACNKRSVLGTRISHCPFDSTYVACHGDGYRHGVGSLSVDWGGSLVTKRRANSLTYTSKAGFGFASCPLSRKITALSTPIKELLVKFPDPVHTAVHFKSAFSSTANL